MRVWSCKWKEKYFANLRHCPSHQYSRKELGNDNLACSPVPYNYFKNILNLVFERTFDILHNFQNHNSVTCRMLPPYALEYISSTSYSYYLYLWVRLRFVLSIVSIKLIFYASVYVYKII